MKQTLVTGITRTQCLRIDNALTVPAVSRAFTGFHDMPPVFATAFMVGFVEWVCIEALRPFLDPHEHSVGTHIDMSHVSPTPVGMIVTAKVALTRINGRMLRFDVFCADAIGEIGSGTHERVIIDTQRFQRRVSDRTMQAERRPQ